MNDIKIVEAAYETVSNLPHSNKPLKDVPDFPNEQQMLDHLLYMQTEIGILLASGKREKAMRWLGFMQGVVWALKFKTLDDLKNMNKPSEEQ